MELDLDALERIAKDARTPGPWETRCEGYCEPTRVCHDSEYVIYLGYDFAADLGAQDAEHIAAFDPPTALALIARVRELEAERDRFADVLVKTGEDADRYREAIEDALDHAPVLGDMRWRKVDLMIGTLRRALNAKEAEK